MTIHEHFKAAEIDAMPAGREMDALVAEYVMGWIGYNTNEKGEYNLSVPNFSTDIAAAWEVVNKIMSALGIVMLITSTGTTIQYARAPNMRGRRYIEFEVTAETAPLAICRSALKTVII